MSGKKRTHRRCGASPGQCLDCGHGKLFHEGPDNDMVTLSATDSVGIVKTLRDPVQVSANSAELINGITMALMDNANKTYGRNPGCKCNDWRSNPFRTIFNQNKLGDQEDPGTDCSHIGNNPLDPELIAIQKAGIADAVLAVAFRNDDNTRLSAAFLYAVYVVSLPPQGYFHSIECQHVTSMLLRTLSAGSSRASKFAAMSVGLIATSASASRPIDFNLSFWHAQIMKLQKQYENQPIPDGQRHYPCDVCRKPVEKKAMTCSGCKSVTYCSRECQKEGWKHRGHRQVCTELLKIRDLAREDGWRPQRGKFMCMICSFGPANTEHMTRHVDLAKHAPYPWAPVPAQMPPPPQ